MKVQAGSDIVISPQHEKEEVFLQIQIRHLCSLFSTQMTGMRKDTSP